MRNKFLASLALGAGVGLAAPQAALAQPVTYDVSGVFTNDCGDGSAWIELRDADDDTVASQSIADGASFTFEEVEEGDYQVVPFAPAGCGTTPYPGGADITVDGADVTGVDVGLVSVYSIWGIVTGCDAGDGEGVNDVEVTLDIDTDELEYSATTRTRAFSEDGEFFFQYLPATDGYTVTATPPEGCQIENPAQEVDITDGDVDDVAFALERAPTSSGSLGSLDVGGSLGSPGSFGSSGFSVAGSTF